MNIQFVLTELNKNMSDSKVGEIIGVTRASVSRLRRGDHKEPQKYSSYEALKNLAIKHGIDVEN
ncbi:MAG: hypothetical protein KAT04_13015 [Methylococcales bacterium]|nr:hypothetical protein [Methylococcales bacterium]